MHNRNGWLVGGIFIAVLAIALVGTQAGLAGSKNEERKVPGQYIVVLKDNASPDGVADDFSKKHGLKVGHVYKQAIKGLTIEEVSDAKLKEIKNDPRVEFISEDREVYALGRPTAKGKTITALVQTLPTGVNRIQANLNSNKGAGVVVAVIDTGIQLSHPDLAGNILNSGKGCIRKASANDDNGHGTHVAGTIAALDNSVGVVGVAPQAKLIPVKVLDRNGNGTWSSVICGIDWVTANAAKYNIKVANMSLGGGGVSDNNCGNSNNDALHKAICRSRDAGVTYVVAAGNSAADASTSVPSAYDDAVITVSALADSDGLAGGLGSATGYGADDTFASFSNFGSVVDLGAPGVNIYSTWKGGGYATISGTSMAAPHVSGSAALYIQSHPGSTWTAVRDGLRALGEGLGFGHTDPSGLHPEPVVNASSL